MFQKLKAMRGEFNRFFIIKKNREALTVLCTVGVLKKWEKLRDADACFTLLFFRALTAFCVLYNRTEHSQDFSIFELLIARDWSKHIT